MLIEYIFFFLEHITVLSCFCSLTGGKKNSQAIKVYGSPKID